MLFCYGANQHPAAGSQSVPHSPPLAARGDEARRSLGSREQAGCLHARLGRFSTHDLREIPADAPG